MTVNTTVDVTGFLAPEIDFAISLGVGWNQIGHPRTYPVAWGDAKVRYQGTTVSISEAHINGWVMKFLYRYDTATGGYEVAEAPDGVLSPWSGYLVKALVECELLIPATPMP